MPWHFTDGRLFAASFFLLVFFSVVGTASAIQGLRQELVRVQGDGSGCGWRRTENQGAVETIASGLLLFVFGPPVTPTTPPFWQWSLTHKTYVVF